MNHGKNETAYHEAGHAVASYYLGVPFEKVTVVSGEGYLGQLVQDAYDGYSRKIIRKHIIIYFAGELAERLSGYRDWDNYFSYGDSGDYAGVEEISSRVYKTLERRRCYLQEIRQEAIELVLSPEWSNAIKALAKALYKAKELDYNQSVMVIRDSDFGD